ncbi:biotin transporter BioY [Oleispirillum naphthae]|uniref:biotin transporter BioY n=1 Tax=Oleispirillum naphthae TaxID=2838853 RepID=UPI003082302E
MSDFAEPEVPPIAEVPPLLWARRQSLPVQGGLLIAGVMALVLSSRVAIPVGPVPVTLQTLAVSLVGALYGRRLGGACVVAWLLAGAAGLPVFAGASAGVQKFLGPTAGYLFAFPLAAMAVGWLVERGWDRGRFLRLLALMVLSNAICLLFGAAWLGSAIGLEKALIRGVAPFLVGAALKSILGALVLALLSARSVRA